MGTDSVAPGRRERNHRVTGLAGTGKTALAAVAARQIQREGRFLDGIAVVLCQGLADPAEVLQIMLSRFDPYRREPEATELLQMQGMVQATLRGKHALVVLDNLEPDLPVAAVVAPPRAAVLTLLLTAHQMFPSEAVPVDAGRTLDLLTQEEALDLCAVTLGRSSPDALAQRSTLRLSRSCASWANILWQSSSPGPCCKRPARSRSTRPRDSQAGRRPRVARRR